MFYLYTHSTVVWCLSWRYENFDTLIMPVSMKPHNQHLMTDWSVMELNVMHMIMIVINSPHNTNVSLELTDMLTAYRTGLIYHWWSCASPYCSWFTALYNMWLCLTSELNMWNLVYWIYFHPCFWGFVLLLRWNK